MSFTSAAQALREKGTLPTAFNSAQLQQIPAELRERAFFSSTVLNAQYLNSAKEKIAKIAEGLNDGNDVATARLALRNELEALGYTPEEGKEGTLQDLSSDRRLNVFIETNLDQAQGYGRYLQQQEPSALEAFPAIELLRVRDSKQERNWQARWLAAGGTIKNGRMVALKNSGIPEKVSRFGVPYGAPDFGSGMDWLDVSREESEALGLLKPSDPAPQPESRRLNKNLSSTTDKNNISPALAAAIIKALKGIANFDQYGRLIFT
jgi:hypothetical protein